MRRVAAVLCLGVLGVSAGAAPIAADPQESSAPNPLALYPRRPGAKYFDVEVEPGATARLPLLTLLGVSEPPLPSLSGFSVPLTLTRWSVVSRAAVPAGLVPADRSRFRSAGLLEGFSPVISGGGDRVLRVEVRTDHDPGDLLCVATAASDGSVALPLQASRRFGRPSPPSSTPQQRPTAEVYLPIGSYTGRFYLACAPGSLFPVVPVSMRAVWGIDV